MIPIPLLPLLTLLPFLLSTTLAATPTACGEWRLSYNVSFPSYGGFWRKRLMSKAIYDLDQTNLTCIQVHIATHAVEGTQVFNLTEKSHVGMQNRSTHVETGNLTATGVPGQFNLTQTKLPWLSVPYDVLYFEPNLAVIATCIDIFGVTLPGVWVMTRDISPLTAYQNSTIRATLMENSLDPASLQLLPVPQGAWCNFHPPNT